MTHGTAFALGQFAEVSASITRALPRALAGIDPKTLLDRMNRGGEDLERMLGETLRALVGIAPTPAKEQKPATPALPTPTSYPVTVPYQGNTTIKELVAAGMYDWHDDRISDAHFPQRREGAEGALVELVHFNRSISSDDVLNELDQRGLRAANPAELLAFGVTHPAVQREFPIVALGQHCHINRHLVVGIDAEGHERHARLYWLGSIWHRSLRFAAVRK